MKTPALTALLGLSVLLSPASGTILLNEIHINPPPTLDLNYEFIELRSSTDGIESCAGLTLLIIENNGAQVGEVEEALDLSSFSTGSNGLLLIGNGYDESPLGGPWTGFKAPSTSVADPSGTPPFSSLGDDNIDPNGGLTVLLVSGWTGMTNATATSLGDVDVDIGANPSAEGGDDDVGGGAGSRKIVDIIESFRLVEQPSYDNKAFMGYVKPWLARVAE